MDNDQENKLNFEEEETAKKAAELATEKVEQAKEEVREDAKGLIKSSKHFIYEIFGFRQDTDRDATIEAIKNDIPFKGATAWILICSIFVASVGLNANSTAVVIGAMLISPLMGPILGIGMALAINDIDTLKKSLINFLVMVVLSVLTAFLFFKFFPLREDSSELLSRTAPDIRDVLIAFFGGLALIIARTKKGTIASVIFGVAIATALMPPLCTVGYGLAKGFDPGLTAGTTGYTYAIGAMYLFGINTIFIASATFLVLKLLRFPMIKYANSKKRRNTARFALFLAILTIVPAVLTFMDVLKESKIDNQLERFVQTEVKGNDALQLLRYEVDKDSLQLRLSFLNEITEATKTDLTNEFETNPLYPNLNNYSLKIKGSDMKSFDVISTAYTDARGELIERKKELTDLKNQIQGLNENIDGLNQQIEAQNATKKSGIAFSAIAKDAKIQFTELEYFGYAKMLESKDFISVDTVVVATVRWNINLNDSLVNIKQNALGDWLKQRLSVKDVVIKRE